MRSSDQATLARVLLSLVIVYLVIVRANPYITIALIAIAFITDGIDGYLAVREASHGSVGFLTYLKSAFGNAKAQSAVRTIKESISQTAPYGARIDVAGDRVAGVSFVVHGNVQGVGYRWLVKVSAERCGITGSVRNMPDGSVKISAYGDPGRLDMFKESISVDMPSGPSVMHMESVAIETRSGKIPEEFVIEPT